MQIHFSSSQAIIWLTLGPCRYRLLDIDALTDPDICLAYPHEPYPSLVLVQPEKITEIHDTFKACAPLTKPFICARRRSALPSHAMEHRYMRYDEFLEKNIAFRFGGATG